MIATRIHCRLAAVAGPPKTMLARLKDDIGKCRAVGGQGEDRKAVSIP
jgi:hypothetical protein